MSNAAIVEIRLLGIMHSWPMSIGTDCQSQLSDLIRSAAKRIENDGVAADPAKIAEAEHNLRVLLAVMTREAGVQGLFELRESTFQAAMSQLCPIFPFC